MKKLKVVSIVGTRPEIIRLSRVFAKLEEYCDHTLVHTGQNYDYELNQVFFDDLGIRKPDYFLECSVNSLSVAQTIGNIITNVDQILFQLSPDAVLVLGDTNSCLSVISAKRRKIPIFHMEGGNRCFDMRVPEEINRRIVDHTADVNLTYSSIARDYLVREGVPPDLIIKIGSPMNEVLSFYRPQIESSRILERLSLERKKYFVVSAHREENIDNPVNFEKLIYAINTIADETGLSIIFSTHPRTQKRIESTGVIFHKKVKLIKPLGFFDYIQLQRYAFATLSDSGTINEESSILNFPALNIREAHERPEGMEEAAVMMVGVNLERIRQALKLLEKQKRGEHRTIEVVGDYATENVSDKVVRIIHSYTDYVNQVVWKKYQN